MQKYRVTFHGSVSVVVDAENEDTATELAETMIVNGKYPFDYTDFSVDIDGW